MPRAQTCPHCGKGQLRVRTSWRAGNYQRQRLECPKCDFKTTETVQAAQIFRREIVA